ncbi:MAG: hypothetical protein KDD88_00815 [Rhodobacteraceae bacterium]|nr:hypothetical protein [Paracoccaceae bacterium]
MRNHVCRHARTLALHGRRRRPRAKLAAKEALAALLPLGRPPAPVACRAEGPVITSPLECCSIEVMLRSAEKIAGFRAFLPGGTTVCIARFDGTPAEKIAATTAIHDDPRCPGPTAPRAHELQEKTCSLPCS